MVSIQEYLTTSYEGDREYVDGEILERHSGERAHSSAQAAMGFLLFQREAQAGVRTLMSQRLRVGPTRFRVPDVCVLMASDPRDPIVSHPPFLCVEILCREDTVTRLNEKLADYFQMGVRYVWVLDPLTRRAFCYTPGQMHEVLDGTLRAKDPNIEVPLLEVFEAED
jgi:Uma2 family endonuclease